MEKLPFQFGLKAVFKATTIIAALLGIGTAVPQLPLFVVAVAAISLPFVLCGVFCNNVAISLMESAPRQPPDA